MNRRTPATLQLPVANAGRGTRRVVATFVWLLRFVVLAGLLCVDQAAASNLDDGFAVPPAGARTKAYWWWINGNVTKAAITRDLEQMKAKGWGGALICDADGSQQDGNDRVPHGPTFFSPEWRELYQHALAEADRLGLEISLNIQSGWNLGGPMVPPAEAPKKLVWTEARISGPQKAGVSLAMPPSRDGFYRDLFVLAYRAEPNPRVDRIPLQNLAQKALLRPLEPFSAPDSRPLFQEVPGRPGEADSAVEQVLDLTGKLGSDGHLDWDCPPGDWVLLRFGFTLNDHCRVSTCSEGWEGYAVDPFDATAFQHYWDAVVEPLIADAGPYAGKSLKYLHTDSWEVEVANWTPSLREEFRQRRGYDLLPWLPVIAGKIINSRDESNRFLHDFRRTMGDLAIDHHYRLFRDRAHQHGLLIHPESGGPHAVPIDAQQCLGFNDAPMSEFWAWSWRHRVGDANRFFVKQPASAAHVYGRGLVLAEGFTTIGPHWQETLWDNLKPAFDHACSEGLNQLVWHAFVCSPESAGAPGQQYFAGTHMNPNVTWWDKSDPFITYLNRCQFLLQQGRFVADVLYYYGNHVPNFAQLRAADPAQVGPGYDYDVVTEEALLTRVRVQDGQLVLPDDTTYRMLVLEDKDVISLPVLERVLELVRQGATVVMSRPKHASGLAGYPQADTKIKALAAQLLGDDDAELKSGRSVGAGRVFSGLSAREVLSRNGVGPDFDYAGSQTNQAVDYIHRRAGGADIYFVANRSKQTAVLDLKFRMTERAPEIWDAVSGRRWLAPNFQMESHETSLSVEFPPCGSFIFVFRSPATNRLAHGRSNSPQYRVDREIGGPWKVQFDPRWGGPAEVAFDGLTDWAERPEPGIKYYSGTAVYRKILKLDAPTAGQALWLDLGTVRELAEVKLNGKSCGITWTPPFRVDLSPAAKSGDNLLEVEVVNFWPNRIIGDAALPAAQRYTKTNIRKLAANTPLMPSGLFGPVRLLIAEAMP